ncbi:unnamed protein product, partial [Rotaria sp. Silwood1]
VEHAVRPDRPRTSVNEQTIDAVRAIIEDDPHSTYEQIEFEEGQSCHVFNIITGDESWFYHYNPETKEQSKVWKSKTDPCPTKVHRKKSSGKRMVAVFFMKSGLIKTVPLEAGATLNAS